MIKIVKEREVPRELVRCWNCGSELEYGNGDLNRDYDSAASYLGVYTSYYFHCPVCGCKVTASLVSGKKSDGPQEYVNDIAERMLVQQKKDLVDKACAVIREAFEEWDDVGYSKDTYFDIDTFIAEYRKKLET